MIERYLFVISLLLIAILVARDLITLWNKEKRMWNDGECKCGGKWKTTGEDTVNGIPFTCDHCGKIIYLKFYTVKPLKHICEHIDMPPETKSSQDQSH